MDLDKYGPWALIVGGSEGIGESYARKLAAQGFKLVLTARKTGPLQDLADDLRADGAEVRILSVDLSRPDALEQTRTVTDDVEVGLLIYNAGANKVRGDFVELDPAVYRDVITINVLGQAEFARHYGGLMRARGRGGIILSGSHASFMGAPTLAAYCGSKAFSRIFSEALWIECQKYGVDVLHVSIGLTATPAMVRAGYTLDAAQSPDDAAQEALDNIANGPLWIAGGHASLEIAINRSTIQGRAEAVRAFATPGRF
ncbi:SDR family NAD(P)-dependent oxidoreductase [Frankia sp. CNm7]|uniref:SDR family NAD(P)-dependent oxidoreductase n=1 Tax=Frankia nepalensis TaxID=1836974 RepID=A0A937UPK6_9ACTN|nr:SDR family NAD(P)-dependent oxidoreductase [Frankia nepalensis]MBL7496621.1 SDR family NAD(P)-dependent oxidoreductase [Frankia nepalensis]MBL7511879.1 SDR family NAD(P)-dependent oxidoreductase [Frankia nepalensis]MBL7516630.1 SDR family NAD(P)-dependent oxidoreductase [Frankia nepalensis]MBL7627360.1 SDR family NAD(P)-dependent oxidoreductase [Frankia nepalensis]